MKKTISIILVAIATSLGFAAEKPLMTIVAQNPKTFFANATDVMRKVYPDPQAEMTLALSLSAFGYPNFEGISPKDNFAISLFGNPVMPETFAAIKATPQSSIYKFAQQTNMRRFEKDGWLVIQIRGAPTTDVSQYADASIAAASKKESSALSVTIEKFDIVKSLPIPPTAQVKQALAITENFAEQIEFINLTLNYDGKSLLLKTNLTAKDKSAIASMVNALPSALRVSESAFIPQNAMFTVLTSLNTKTIVKHYENFLKSILKSVNITPETFTAFSESAKMSSGTSASAMSILSFDKFENVSVAKTEIGLKEYIKITSKLNDASLKTFSDIADSKITEKMFSFDGIEACEYSIKLAQTPEFDNKLFLCVYDNYLINSSSLELLKSTVAKIKNPPSEYPFKKYAASDCAAVLIINNAKIMKLIFAQFGVDFNGSADNFETFIYLGKNAIRSKSELQISTMRAYADIFRKISELSAEMEKAAAASTVK